MTAQVGEQAPDFTLPATTDEGKLTLSDLRGKPVVLTFYPMAFTGNFEKGVGCRVHLRSLEDQAGRFTEAGATLLGVSCDAIPSQKAFAEEISLTYPLLSDWEPKGDVSRAYEVYNAERGNPLRSAFVIDANGVIRYREVYTFPANPDPDVLLAEVAKLG